MGRGAVGTDLDGLEGRGGLPAAGELEHGEVVGGEGRYGALVQSRLSKERLSTTTSKNSLSRQSSCKLSTPRLFATQSLGPSAGPLSHARHQMSAG
jgi:hypothetical protein